MGSMKKEMNAKHRCPRCGSADLLEFKDVVKCMECRLMFRTQFLNKIDDDKILAEEEKKAFLDIFFNEFVND